MTSVDIAADVVTRTQKHLSSGRAALARLMGSVVEVRSEGAWVIDADGRRHLDFGGYGVFILGHCHPAVVAAVQHQVATHPLATRTLLEPVIAQAAEALAGIAPPGLDHVHFVNSGTEATEAALKLARAHGHHALITTAGGFHGKTLGALSVTANPTYQDQFRPLLPDVTVVPFGDAAAMSAAIAAAGRAACVILEPVQGEGGVVIPPPGYLTAVAAACAEHGAFLIIDEIQTGLGRLGSWWGIDTERVAPDVLLVGKGLSGGIIPVAAMLAGEQTYGPFNRDPFLHSSTFGGSPLAGAAALAAVRTMAAEDIPRRAARLGSLLLDGVRARAAAHGAGLVADVRGRGLLIGIEMAEQRHLGELALALIDRGVLVSHSLNASRVIRLTPPAILGDPELALFFQVFDDALASLTAMA
ncbi:aminotransferase [Catellatospora sp. TT07R-123]|uniref:aspartate aminotransferase family protein n=1 Tax=Catellatospora sp. TT07R-123 TaxID=2733863 RepID=UPI001B2C4B2A|nr:aminotransferase class III-fold pyridoxal phosphate-dependent enzyme [Catellatospora sp. TT07R-123]GHJ43222.1 aminotransferase [Catellatospora sp. TT07R-123]